MSNNMQISNAAASAAMDAVTALLNGGSLKFYDGVQPANANTAITTQKLLCSCAFGTPAFAASVNGVANANAIAVATIGTNGTASWARCFKADGTSVVCDLSVDTSNADIIVPTTTFVSGVQLSISALTLTHPLH